MVLNTGEILPKKNSLNSYHSLILMAQNESDREDLMAEATALRRRVELQVPSETEHTIAGFRDDGRFSLYFGPDPVYHFDGEGGLRRAYLDGKLYRTQGTTLARLTRNRTEQATLLRRNDLSELELQEFLHAMRCRLQNLQELYLYDTPVSDVTPLAGLENLQLLRLWSVSEEEVEKLRQALPNCLIIYCLLATAANPPR